MKNKPLVRWTVGPVSNLGWEILAESVKTFGKIYPEFDRIVCYNHISDERIDFLKSFGVDLYKSEQDEIFYPLTPPGPNPSGFGDPASGWKLMPARLKINSHELWLDNDILIVDRVPVIDHWIQNDWKIISEGLFRIFGAYDHKVKAGIQACAGLFGCPPGFDFQSEIIELCNEVLQGEPLGHYDEQGLVAAIMTNGPFRMVPMRSVKILQYFENLPDPLPHGMHMVGINRNKEYKPWEQYKCLTT